MRLITTGGRILIQDTFDNLNAYSTFASDITGIYATIKVGQAGPLSIAPDFYLELYNIYTSYIDKTNIIITDDCNTILDDVSLYPLNLTYVSTINLTNVTTYSNMNLVITTLKQSYQLINLSFTTASINDLCSNIITYLTSSYNNSAYGYPPIIVTDTISNINSALGAITQNTLIANASLTFYFTDTSINSSDMDSFISNIRAFKSRTKLTIYRPISYSFISGQTLTLTSNYSSGTVINKTH
jgi:hypothetical protein